MALHRVLYTFEAEGEGELSVHAGQLVVVLPRDDATATDGWLCVETTVEPRLSGFVPADYVRPVTVPEPAPAPAPVPVATPAPAPAPSSFGGASAASAGTGGASAGASMPAWSAAPPSVALVVPPSFPVRTPVSPSATTSAMQSEEFAHLFESHDEWFKSAMARRGETYRGLQATVTDLSRRLIDCDARNVSIVKRVAELEAIIEDERAKWAQRLEQEQSALAAGRSLLE